MASTMAMVPYRNYFDSSPPLTVEEREYLYDIKSAHRTAFNPRQIQSSCSRRPPRTWRNIEINHRLRSSVPESCKPQASDPFRLWIESSRRMPPFPPNWDPEYNSNLWRNYSHGEGYTIQSPGRRVTEVIASMYPIKIPPHSEMKDHTFSKFLSEVPIIQDPKRRHLAISHSVKELQDFQKLKLRSEMRVPPMDSEGHIVPPHSYKKHKQRFKGEPHMTMTQKFREMNEIDRESQRSRLGTHMTSPNRLWKLSFKDNNPEYEKVQLDVAEKKATSQKLRRKAKSPASAQIFFK